MKAFLILSPSPPPVICASDYSFFFFGPALASHPSPETAVHCSSMCTSIISTICPLTTTRPDWRLALLCSVGFKEVNNLGLRTLFRMARGNVTLLCFCCFRSTFDPRIVPRSPTNMTSTTLYPQHPAFSLALHKIFFLLQF